MNQKFFIALLTIVSFSLPSAARADMLLSIDFAGTPSSAISTLASGNSQLTVNPAITFGTPGSAFNAVGSFALDGTGTAATAQNLLVGATNFGSTSRFDIDFGLATAGNSYSITRFELDMRANNQSGARFAAGYRDLGNMTHTVGETAVAVQTGTDPIATYAIDLTAENLFATDATSSFVRGGTGKIRFLFREVPGTSLTLDNFQVDAIRVFGNVTAVPEVSSLALMGIATGGVGMVWRRRKQRVQSRTF
ncbi:MAG: PEP-CTERM sorting domain-containing protein [Rubripirellula sp.]